MGVSKNRGTPKWMVYNGNTIEMDDLGVPPIFGNTHINRLCFKGGRPEWNHSKKVVCSEAQVFSPKNLSKQLESDIEKET